MKHSIEYMIQKYVRAGKCKDFKTQESYAKQMLDTADCFDEMITVYILYVKANINGQCTASMQENLLETAKSFGELKDVYLWANERKDSDFANLVKKKIYRTAGFFELQDFYYFASGIEERLGRPENGLKKEVALAAARSLPLIGKLF